MAVGHSIKGMGGGGEEGVAQNEQWIDVAVNKLYSCEFAAQMLLHSTAN